MVTRLNKPIFVTIPADTVSLHRWIAGATVEEEERIERDRQAGIFGEQIGEGIPAGNEPVTFPGYVGDPCIVHCVAWRDGAAMFWTRPVAIRFGGNVTMTLPIDGHLSSG